MNTTFTKTISIKDVYGEDSPDIPKRFKAIDFRLPRKGEFYLGRTGALIEATDDHGRTIYAHPFLILSKLPDPVVIKGNVEYEAPKDTVASIYYSDVTIPEGYEFVDFRPPRDKDFFISAYDINRTINKADYTWNPSNTKNARIIVRKVTP